MILNLSRYRNIIDCWLENDSKIGMPNIGAVTPGTDLKRCFFSLDVKKGAWNYFGLEELYLELDPEEEFPNFSGSD